MSVTTTAFLLFLVRWWDEVLTACVLVGRKTRLSSARSRVVWTRLYHHTLWHHIHSRFRLYNNCIGTRRLSAY